MSTVWIFTGAKRIVVLIMVSVALASCASSGSGTTAGNGPPSFDELRPNKWCVVDRIPSGPTPPLRTRDEVLALLRRDGIYAPRTRLVSITKESDRGEWRVTLQHPLGARTYWTVSQLETSYWGGSEPDIPPPGLRCGGSTSLGDLQDLDRALFQL